MKIVVATLVFFICLAHTAHGQFRKRARKQKNETKKEVMLNYSNPKEYYIGGIVAKGLTILDENAMLSLTGLKVGDKIQVPGDHISNAIRKLWKHGLVGDVSIAVEKIEGQNIFLIIQMSERLRLSDFYFSGIGRGRQSALREDLSLIRGKIVNDAMIKNTELSVKRFFAKKGFLNARVKITQEQDTVNRGAMKLHIAIDPQAKIRINEINIEGSKDINAAKLKRKMKKTKEHTRFILHRTILGALFQFKKRPFREYLSPSQKITWKGVKRFIERNIKPNIFAGSKFIQSDFEDDKNLLVAYYNTQGYRDATIFYDTITQHNANTLDVKLKINEGHKYYFRNISWTGNHIHNDETLDLILDIKKGDIYNREMIDKKTAFNPKGTDISGLYMDNGYLFFRVTPVEIAVEGDSIDIEMRIFEGDQATIRRVLITGNDKTNEHVIRRELSTLPGQKFSRSDIIRTQQQLSQIGLFDPQKVEPNIMPNPEAGTVDIEWRLEEQSNDQVQLSGGWGGNFGFVGTVGLTFNNFSLRNIFNLKKWNPLPTGDGQRLSLSVQANGPGYQNYNFSFTEPWLGGRKPHSLTLSVNHSVSRLALSAREYSNESALFQTGVTIGLGRRLEFPDNYFTLLNSLSFLVYDYGGNYFQSTSLPEKGRTINLKLQTTLSRNSVNNPMFPTRGSNISLSLALTPPYSLIEPSYLNEPDAQFRWVEMHKWMFDAKFYIKLIGSKKPDGRSLVLQAKAHFGFVGRYNDAIQQSPFERFLLGGDGLAGGFNSFVLGQDIIGLRGYTNNSITPPLYALRGSTNSSSIEGGIAYTKLGIELRYPVTISQTATIYGFLFAEGGNNWDNFYDFDPFNIYKSAGAGLRIFMPAFGLIGLNWGYGFDTIPGSLSPSGSQFHFTIGQQIR